MPSNGQGVSVRVTPFASKRARTAEMCCAALVVLALAVAAILAAWPPGAEAATGDTRPPTAAQTRAALRSAPQTMSLAATAILTQQKYAAPVVSDLIKVCPGLKQGLPSQAEQALVRQAVAASNVILRGQQGVKQFGDKARGLRRYLPALPPRRRLTLDRAIALMLGAEGFWRDNITANFQAAEAVAGKDCGAALEFRGAAEQHRERGNEAWVEALGLLQALARTA